MTVMDEDALTCDFAEVYGVYDLRSLPLLTAATLAQGLGADSRIVRRLTDVKIPQNTMLLATVADRLGHLIWMLTEDGSKGENHPRSILDAMLGKKPEKETAGFASGEDFDAEWKRLTEEAGHGN